MKVFASIAPLPRRLWNVDLFFAYPNQPPELEERAEPLLSPPWATLPLGSQSTEGAPEILLMFVPLPSTMAKGVTLYDVMRTSGPSNQMPVSTCCERACE